MYVCLNMFGSYLMCEHLSSVILIRLVESNTVTNLSPELTCEFAMIKVTIIHGYFDY